MGRVINYWIVLGTIAAVTTYGGGFLIFGQIDLSFLQFATLLSAPLLQAVVLAWREAQPLDDIVAVFRSLFRRPLAQPVLGLDVLMLGAGIVWWDAHRIGLGAATDIHATWTLVKAGAATAFCAYAIWRAGARERMTMAGLVIPPLLLVFALEPSTSWLAAAFARVHAALATGGEVFQRLGFYGVIFGALIALTIRSAARLQQTSREAATLIGGAVAAAIVLAVAVVLASFNLPTVTQPWLGLAALSASVAATSVLLAGIVLATTESTGN